MVRARWTALAVLAALVTGAAGCGSSGGEKGTDVRKVVFVAPYSDNEPDWTKQAQEVLEEWPRRLHVGVDKVDASQTGDVRAALEQVAHEGNQLVIAHDSSYADDAEAVARRTRVPTLVWGERSNAPEGLVGQITVQDKEAGYMAGIVSTKAAGTRRLGIIVIADGTAWETATWNRIAGGYVAGARSIEPRTRIYFEQVGQDGDATPQEVYDAALRMQRRHRAQIIFALGGASTSGALRAVEEVSGENQFYGVIGDKARLDRDAYSLGSVMFDTRPVFEQALHDLRRGTFAQHPYELTLANHGVWIFTTGRTPVDAYEAAVAAGGQIQRGRIQVPVTSTSEAVEELIAGGTAEG
ncbi:MAG TPA: BMP family ABC transporter substrate-binding protein [Conexibacter sp.]